MKVMRDPDVVAWRESRVLAQAIQAERERRGDTLGKAAALIGVARAALQSYLGNAQGTCHLAGWYWPAVADYLGWTVAEVERAAKADRARYQSLLRELREAGDEVAEIDEADYPLLTMAGVMLGPPIPQPTGWRRGCAVCEALEACREAVANGCFALCERALQFELFPVEEEAVA